MLSKRSNSAQKPYLKKRISISGEAKACRIRIGNEIGGRINRAQVSREIILKGSELIWSKLIALREEGRGCASGDDGGWLAGGWRRRLAWLSHRRAMDRRNGESMPSASANIGLATNINGSLIGIVGGVEEHQQTLEAVWR
jgi:hypothetical protein